MYVQRYIRVQHHGHHEYKNRLHVQRYICVQHDELHECNRVWQTIYSSLTNIHGHKSYIDRVPINNKRV
jgi:hypothetical protein